MFMTGELPTGSVIVAACDSEYFIQHAPAFVSSISENTDQSIHIHVANPTDEVFSLACILSAVSKNRVTYTFNEYPLTRNKDADRTYYACLRFLIANKLLSTADDILILDIDCLVMRKIEKIPSEYSIGYFPREPIEGTVGWERDGTKVAAGAVYFSASEGGKFISHLLQDMLSRMTLRWFADQIAISEVFAKHKNHAIEFDSQFMDWEFVEGTTIWTGKGPRKYENQTYLQKKSYFETLVSQKINSWDKVLLFPRQDISFKETLVVSRDRSWLTHEIRQYWVAYKEQCVEAGYSVIESPRWMFNSSIEKFLSEKVKSILVGHVEKKVWGGSSRVKYYMQTVFPWLFTEDSIGWGGGLGSLSDLNLNDYPQESKLYNELKLYVEQGMSKFQQPDFSVKYDGEYIFVPLQLPHDETIKYHSNVSVEKFVEKLCIWSETSGKKIVFKGHPANLGSMRPLIDTIEKYRNCTYITQASIYEMAEGAEAVYVINSGVGQECMVKGHCVVAFGDAEYSPAVISGDIDNLDRVYQQVRDSDFESRLARYKRWFAWYEGITTPCNIKSS